MDSTLDETKNPNPNAVGTQGPSTPVRVKRDIAAGSARRGDEIITPASLVPLMGALHEYLDGERRRNARRMGMLGLAFVVILIVAAAYPIYLGRVLLTRMEQVLGENRLATQRLANSAESGLIALTNSSVDLRIAIEQQVAAMRMLSTAESGLSALTNMSASLRIATEQQVAAMRMLSTAESGLRALTNTSAELRAAIEQQAAATRMLSTTASGLSAITNASAELRAAIEQQAAALEKLPKASTSQLAVAAHVLPVQVQAVPAVAETPPTSSKASVVETSPVTVHPPAPSKASVVESSPVTVRPPAPPPVTSAVTPPKSSSGPHLFMRRPRLDSASPKARDDAPEDETGP